MKDVDLNNLDPEEKKRLIKESQMASIKTSDSKTLAAHVVAYRFLNINKEIALACMTELMERKDSGDDYDFEAYIDEELVKLPKAQGTDYAKIIRGMQKNVQRTVKKGI